ncbi:MAG: penicillin-binding transpeptidase domain-containing protein [Bacillota bacterium]
MSKFFENRPLLLRAIFGLLFVVLLGALFNLTVIEAGAYSTLSNSSKQRTIIVKGQRGQILDCNSVPLAVDKTSYNIEFYRDPSKRSSKYRAMYTEVIRKTIKIIEENGGKIKNNFSITRDKTGAFVFDFKTTDSDIAKKRENMWRSNMYLQNEELTPYDCYMRLRDKYQIPEDVTYDEAVKVLSVWQDVQYTYFTAYVPVTIAQDVNQSTVAQIESRADELTGMSAVEANVRTYPKGLSAAHIVGYIGKMQDKETIETYSAKGYSGEDQMGVSGIEQTMEDYLTANSTEKQGYKVVEVNSNGEVVNTLKSVDPESGNNVMLTIDMNLQQKLEEALEKNIQTINAKQKTLLAANLKAYAKEAAEANKDVNKDGKKDVNDIKLAETGAAVVMNVKTGEILAMASYPSFDPNLFVGGISEADYALYRDDKRSPLFNKAISSKATPGSIFKLVTGLGGLMEEKITVNTKIDDEGPFNPGGTVAPGMKAPHCWVSPNYWKHQDQDIVAAVKNSCNYFFMTVAYKLGIDNLNKWGKILGLTDKTGIELPAEATGQIGGQNILYDGSKGIQEQHTSLPYLVQLQLQKDVLPTICSQQNVKADDKTLERCAQRLVEAVANSDNTWGAKIRQILREEFGISETISNEKGYHKLIASSLYQISWNPTLTAVSGMGQGYVTVTPIAVARYISALVNGGTVYDAHIVKKVVSPSGEVIKEVTPTVFDKLDVPSLYLDKLKEGMREVVSTEDGGTASEVFRNFEYTDEIGGKTGTAQVSDIDLENNAWFVCFAPKDDPQIAVVVFIPNGYKGSLAAETAKEVVKYYMDKKNGATPSNSDDVTGADMPTQ